MKTPPRLSASEWIVAHAVWDHPDTTAAQIAGHLPAEVNWKQKTVNTFLTRLAAKGVVGIERQGRTNLYSPLLDRKKCVQDESTSFFRRVLAGAAAPMLAHFCESAHLTEAEIAGLQEILDRKSQAAAKALPKRNRPPRAHP